MFKADLPANKYYTEADFSWLKDAEQTEYQNIFQAGSKPESDTFDETKTKRRAKLANRLGISSLIGFFCSIHKPAVNSCRHCSHSDW